MEVGDGREWLERLRVGDMTGPYDLLVGGIGISYSGVLRLADGQRCWQFLIGVEAGEN